MESLRPETANTGDQTRLIDSVRAANEPLALSSAVPRPDPPRPLDWQQPGFAAAAESFSLVLSLGAYCSLDRSPNKKKKTRAQSRTTIPETRIPAVMPNRPSKGKERKQAPASLRPQTSDNTARKKAQQLQSTFSRTQDNVGFDAERPFIRPIEENLCVLSNDAVQPAGRPALIIPRRPKWRRDRMSPAYCGAARLIYGTIQKQKSLWKRTKCICMNNGFARLRQL